MDKPIGWEWYRTFLAVLQEGSLSGAARVLAITQPTAGRHMAALEAALGQPLFTRAQTGLVPNQTALAMRGYAEAMQATAAAMARAADRSSGPDLVGTVRISASEVVGVEVLPPMLVALQRRHPRLKIELVPTNRVQNLLQHEADIAVRMTTPEQELLIARKLGEVELGLYARDDYLDARGKPLTVADLQHHALLGFDEDSPFLRAARHRLPSWNREAFSMRSSNDLALLALLRAGAGIGFCQLPLAARQPELQPVLAGLVRFALPIWITMHRDLRDSAACRCAFDVLAQGLQAYLSAEALIETP